jgi:hypothetical protein
MSYELIWEERGVLRHFHGCLQASDLINSVHEAHNDWRFDTCLYSLNDFLDVTRVDLPAAEVEVAAAQGIGASLSNRRMILAVVARDPTIVNHARLFQGAPFDVYPLRIFDTREAARAWVEQHVREQTRD